MSGDAIAAAIAAAEQPDPAPRATVKVTLASGRDVLVNVPVDLGALELISVIGYLAGPHFLERLAEARSAQRSPLLVPVHRVSPTT